MTIQDTNKIFDFVFNRLDETPEDRRERLDDARKEDKEYADECKDESEYYENEGDFL